MTIDDEEEVEYPSIVTEKKKEITEQYGELNSEGLYTDESQKVMSEKMNEMRNSSPYKELIDEYNQKSRPILSSSWVITDDDEDCYVMNENKQKFKCTMSPSRRSSYKYIDGNKFDFYETYSMTKYDATDTITMVVNYRGNLEYIELSKIK